MPRGRLHNRQKEVNLAIVRGEIEHRKHDPEFAQKFPGGRLNQKTLEQIQELRDYLSEGLTTMQNSLLRQKAFDCENKWFCHKTHRVTQYLTLLNVNYNPDEPRDELGQWTTGSSTSHVKSKHESRLKLQQSADNDLFQRISDLLSGSDDSALIIP